MDAQQSMVEPYVYVACSTYVAGVHAHASAGVGSEGAYLGEDRGIAPYVWACVCAGDDVGMGVSAHAQQ